MRKAPAAYRRGKWTKIYNGTKIKFAHMDDNVEMRFNGKRYWYERVGIRLVTSNYIRLLAVRRSEIGGISPKQSRYRTHGHELRGCIYLHRIREPRDLPFGQSRRSRKRSSKAQEYAEQMNSKAAGPDRQTDSRERMKDFGYSGYRLHRNWSKYIYALHLFASDRAICSAEKRESDISQPARNVRKLATHYGRR